jgi:hypothetical protein
MLAGAGAIDHNPRGGFSQIISRARCGLTPITAITIDMVTILG